MQKRKYIKRNGKHIKVKCVDGKFKVKESICAYGEESQVVLDLLEDDTIAITVTNRERNTEASARLTLQSFALLFEAMKSMDRILPDNLFTAMQVWSLRQCPQN